MGDDGALLWPTELESLAVAPQLDRTQQVHGQHPAGF
jgi:hypothetical protein